jgi:DNA repair protein RecN (Recombination protein N)
MLRALTIRDFAIVDRLELEFAPGFTALTGETGAGKSILIEALALALGDRADALTVREGADRAEVSAMVDPAGNAGLAQWLEERALDADDGACLMRRVVDRAGRSRGFLNGQAVTLAQLREAAQFMVEIHGQHEHQSLLRAAAQRELLDAYGELETLADDVAHVYSDWSERRERRMRYERDAGALAAEKEELGSRVRELEALGFSGAEWKSLAVERSRLAHGARLAEAAQHGLEALSEADESALSRVNRVIARLEEVVDYDPALNDVLAMLQPAQAQLQEAAYALRRYGERLDLDPARLRQVELRLDAVHAAARKFRVDPEHLPELLESTKARLGELGTGDVLGELRGAEDDAHTACIARAKALTARRRKVAEQLSRQVTEAMQELAMAGGQFEAALVPLDTVTRHGFEAVELRVAAHPGMAPQPVARVASGGELSRLSLALQTVASRAARVPTLIFDEVDAGIGGRVAEIVGRMLKRLGEHHQVLCVTHLPQVAAAADHQWQVSKTAAKGVVQSRVVTLDHEQRVEEIARMLGGVRITDTTRRHAAEMLGSKPAATRPATGRL